MDSAVLDASTGKNWFCSCGMHLYKSFDMFVRNAINGEKHNCYNYRGGVYISKEQEKTMGDPELRPTVGMIEMKLGEEVNLVNHPPHYTTGNIEVIDFIEDQNLGYHLSSVIKYVCRSEHKGNKLLDLEKAKWYLEREISNLKKNGAV